MAKSLYETHLQGIIVSVLIKTNTQSKIATTVIGNSHFKSQISNLYSKHFPASCLVDLLWIYLITD